MSNRRLPAITRWSPALAARLPALFVAAVALALLPAAAQAAKPGELFPINTLAMPPGAIPAAPSGSVDSEPSDSDLSQNGRYIVFPSMAESLAAGSNPNVVNIYRKDRVTGQVVLVSRANGTNGAGVSRDAFEPKISADGNLVTFATEAALTAADSNGEPDIYLRDIAAGTTTLVTPGLASGVDGGHDLSSDGAYIAFATRDALTPLDTNGATDVYRRRISTGQTALVSINHTDTAAGMGIAPFHSSTSPSISGDGRWVAFNSDATDLVAGFAIGNGDSEDDVFVRDMNSGDTHLVSNTIGSANKGGNGRSHGPIIAGTPTTLNTVKVAYSSSATDLDPDNPDLSNAESVYIHDLSLTASKLVSRADGPAGVNADSRAHLSAVSNDGNRVAFYSDATNLHLPPYYYATYVRDVAAGRTVMFSDNNEYTVRGVVSGDGRYAIWLSSKNPTNDSDVGIPGVYGRTLGAATVAELGAIEHISRPAGNAPYLAPVAVVYPLEATGPTQVSADGRYVVFTSSGPRLPGTSPNETPHVYRRDVRTGEIELVSRHNGTGGAPIAEGAVDPSVSADGMRVAFVTPAALDPADTDADMDVYVRDIAAGQTFLVSRADGAAGAGADDTASHPAISADGNRVAFASAADNLGVPASTFDHLYLRDIAAGKTYVVDKASAPSTTVGDDEVVEWTVSGDGRLVAFTTRAKNLDPDDPAANLDVYLRDVATSETTLLSRRPGLGGQRLGSYSNNPVISADGRYVAMTVRDAEAVPGSGPWPDRQVIRREVANGDNDLVSRNAAGKIAGSYADRASISADGTRVSFVSYAENLLPGLGGPVRSAAFVRDFATGTLSGPPAFGLVENQQGVYSAHLSGDGRCMAVYARGHNGFTGPAGDWHSLYMYVIDGDCHRPEAVPDSPRAATQRPRLSRVSLKPRRFAVGKRRTARIAAASDTAGAAKVGAARDAADAGASAANQAAGASASKTKKARKGRKGERRVARGTKIRFRLNTRATVRIGFQRRILGVKVRVRGGARKGAKGTKRVRCRRAPARVVRRVRAKRRCARWRPVGAIVRRNRAGGRMHRVAFSGRIGRRALKPGRYRAVLRARNEAGTSATVRRAFRVVRR